MNPSSLRTPPSPQSSARHGRVSRVWHATALFVVAAVATWNVRNVAGRVARPPTHDVEVPHVMVDQVTRADRRFAALREQARVHGISGTVGYLEDAAPAASVRDADVDYFFAQFALLPLVLDANLSGAQWAVGNFRAPLLPNSIPATWRVVEDSGSGVLLLRRSEP